MARAEGGATYPDDKLRKRRDIRFNDLEMDKVTYAFELLQGEDCSTRSAFMRDAVMEKADAVIAEKGNARGLESSVSFHRPGTEG